MGISSYPRDAQNTEILITSALSALNKAKTDARGFHYYYSKELREQSERRQMILSHLYEAIDRKELYLVYQPKVNALDGNLVGFEALLRWESHVMGFVSPVEFIPVAEESSMIEKIGRWVITQATEDLKRIHDLGHEDMSISVNLSGQQFKDASLFAWILENISELDLKADRFELEITESLLLENLNEAVPQLNMLKESGIVISIDDFGTGYSSLSYLQHLPVDVLKIDRSFLKDLNEDSSGTIINAIIQLGSALEMKVVAEGIENEMQKQFLLNRGCSIHQGYYYSKPEKMDTLIENYKL
jgi:EAL domain-containing protein (putative c-di-GMP-specific phosphodiesterase class I)